MLSREGNSWGVRRRNSGGIVFVYLAGSAAAVCDYSLYAVRQRLACEGDELVTFRFDSGSVGFVSVSDAEAHSRSIERPRERWRRFFEWLQLGMGSRCDATAVCMPPGARLELEIPSTAARHLGLSAGHCAAVFDQISAESFMYRDALRLSDGPVLLLQSLPEGIRARVLTLGSSEMEEAVLLNEWGARAEQSRQSVSYGRRW